MALGGDFWLFPSLFSYSWKRFSTFLRLVLRSRLVWIFLIALKGKFQLLEGLTWSTINAPIDSIEAHLRAKINPKGSTFEKFWLLWFYLAHPPPPFLSLGSSSHLVKLSSWDVYPYWLRHQLSSFAVNILLYMWNEGVSTKWKIVVFLSKRHE